VHGLAPDRRRYGQLHSTIGGEGLTIIINIIAIINDAMTI